MNNEKTIQYLNELLTKNYDAEEGYTEASEHVERVDLQTFFKQQAKNRYDFGHKIKNEIKQLGGQPQKGTSIEGDIHRNWMSVKNSFSAGSKAIVEECIRGEKTSIEEYDELLQDDSVPEKIKQLVQEQKKSIERALHSLQTMDTETK